MEKIKNHPTLRRNPQVPGIILNVDREGHRARQRAVSHSKQQADQIEEQGKQIAALYDIISQMATSQTKDQ